MFIVGVSLPYFAFAQASPGTGITYECVQDIGGQKVYGNCTFNDLVSAVKDFFKAVFPLVFGFTSVIIAYAGYLYMTSGGNSGQRAKANKMFVSLAWGVFFMLAAWTIVTLVLNSLANSSIPRILN